MGPASPEESKTTRGFLGAGSKDAIHPNLSVVSYSTTCLSGEPKPRHTIIPETQGGVRDNGLLCVEIVDAKLAW
jgi:hypothetical protein